MDATKSGNACRDGMHISKINEKHPNKVKTNICEEETCMYDSSICKKHLKLNNEKNEWMARAFDWRNKKVREFGLDPTNPILLARANDRDIIDRCEDVKGHLQTHHEEIMRVTLPELKIADTNVSPESKEVALVSESNNQSTITAGNKPIIDRTGRQSNLNIALLEGNKGDAMVAVFDQNSHPEKADREW